MERTIEDEGCGTQRTMKCVVCKHGETQAGHTTVTLERGGATLVIRKVPAEICENCENCGEAYVSADVTRSLLESARQTLRGRVDIDIREFDAKSA